MLCALELLCAHSAHRTAAVGRSACTLAPEMRFFWAFVMMYMPIAFTAFWYKWDWGGSFRISTWKWDSLCALALLTVITVFICYLGPARIPPLSRAFAITYLYFGLGFSIALFPGAASSFSVHYTALAGAQVTRWYAVVGWMLILYSTARLFYWVFI